MTFLFLLEAGMWEQKDYFCVFIDIMMLPNWKGRILSSLLTLRAKLARGVHLQRGVVAMGLSPPPTGLVKSMLSRGFSGPNGCWSSRSPTLREIPVYASEKNRIRKMYCSFLGNKWILQLHLLTGALSMVQHQNQLINSESSTGDSSR